MKIVKISFVVEFAGIKTCCLYFAKIFVFLLLKKVPDHDNGTVRKSPITTIISSNAPLQAKLTVTFPAQLTIGSTYQPDDLPPAAKVHFRDVTITAIGPWWTPFGQRLTELTLSSYSEVDYATLLAMLSCTPNLRSFTLDQTKLSGERLSREADFRLDKLERLVLRYIQDAAPLEAFRGLCNGLKSLRVSWDCYMEEQIVSPLEMVTFLGGLQNTLVELYITCTEGTLVEVMKLEQLKLRKLTMAGVQQDDDFASSLIELFRMQLSLEYLKIKDILYFDESNHSIICKIGQTLPILHSLQVNVTDVDLAFLNNFPKLQTLKLVGNPDASVSIQFNGGVHTNLKEFQLKQIHFEDSCLQQHLPKLPNLRSISINWCTFNYWSDLLHPLKSLKLLHNLSLNGINVNESADGTVDGFATTLNHLQLSCCEMSPKLLAVVLRGCPSLRELRLQSMELNDHPGQGAESSVVQVICRGLSLLSVLIVQECSLAAGKESYLRENCTPLVELQITGSR